MSSDGLGFEEFMRKLVNAPAPEKKPRKKPRAKRGTLSPAGNKHKS